MLGLTVCTLLLGPSVYVSPAGSDQNPGTLSAPWRTIQYACDHVASGGQVVVSSGIYRERVTITRPLSLLAASGESPVIEGEGLPVPSGRTALVMVKDADRVTVSGFEIRNFRTMDASRVPTGILVVGKADGVTLSGNRIHDIANLGRKKDAINAFGLAVYGDSKTGAITNLRIQGNEIYATKTGSSETLTVNGNVDGFRVLDNRIHDVDNIGIDCIGFEGTSPIKGKDQARNGLVAGNVVERVSSAANPAYGGERSAGGIYVDGGTAITIERNTVRGADIGVEIAAERKGKVSSKVVVRSNLIVASAVCGVSIGGYAPQRGGTTGCTIVNNTLVGNDTTRSGTGEFQIQYNTQGNVFGNNVVVANSQGILVATVPRKGNRIGVAADYNLFDAPASTTWIWQGKAYDTLAKFQKATKLDLHSVFRTPEFVDTDDYRLKDGSPGIDAGWRFDGAVLGALDHDGTTRLQGRSVDLGCYERSLP